MAWSISPDDDLTALPALADAGDQSQRARAVAFALAEAAGRRVTMSGSMTSGDHYLSITIGDVGRDATWHVKKSTRQAPLIRKKHEPSETRKTLHAALKDASTADQRGRAFAFAAAEVAASSYAHASINARGSDTGLALSVSTAD